MQAATAERLPYPPLVWQPPLVVDEAMLVACATQVRDYSDCCRTRFSPSSPERLHSGALERLDVHEVQPVTELLCACHGLGRSLTCAHTGVDKSIESNIRMAGSQFTAGAAV